MDPGDREGMESYLTAELSASALRWNLQLLRGRLDTGTLLCAVVKADAYGHGLPLLLPIISQQADCLAVATQEEALELRRLGYAGPVLMFFSAGAYAHSPKAVEALAELIDHDISLTAVSVEELELIARAARRAGQMPQVHLKIDTGMGRSGAPADQLSPLLDHASRHASLKLAGAYTHLATADEADKSFAMEQLQRFTAALTQVRLPGLIRHAANSAATIDLPQSRLDMVRPGIAIYGYQPGQQMQTRLPLRPILRLTGKIMQIKTLPAGSRCGYGLTHRFDRQTRVGLVPGGYADGYPRSLSDRATMRVRGVDVSVCGRVSMDQVILDLSAVPAARIGDEVEIISADPQAPHSVENLSRLAGTIPYEFTCHLGRRARRVLVDQAAETPSVAAEEPAQTTPTAGP